MGVRVGGGWDLWGLELMLGFGGWVRLGVEVRFGLGLVLWIGIGVAVGLRLKLVRLRGSGGALEVRHHCDGGRSLHVSLACLELSVQSALLPKRRQQRAVPRLRNARGQQHVQPLGSLSNPHTSTTTSIRLKPQPQPHPYTRSLTLTMSVTV